MRPLLRMALGIRQMLSPIIEVTSPLELTLSDCPPSSQFAVTGLDNVPNGNDGVLASADVVLRPGINPKGTSDDGVLASADVVLRPRTSEESEEELVKGSVLYSELGEFGAPPYKGEGSCSFTMQVTIGTADRRLPS